MSDNVCFTRISDMNNTTQLREQNSWLTWVTMQDGRVSTWHTFTQTNGNLFYGHQRHH